MDCVARVLCDPGTGDQAMTNALLMFGGVAVVAALITLYDVVAERVNRKAHKH
jgi:hypothetical protein